MKETEIVTVEDWLSLASINHETAEILVHPRFHKLSKPIKLLIVTQLQNLKKGPSTKEYLEADNKAFQKVWAAYPETPKKELIDEFSKILNDTSLQQLNEHRLTNLRDFLTRQKHNP